MSCAAAAGLTPRDVPVGAARRRTARLDNGGILEAVRWRPREPSRRAASASSAWWEGSRDAARPPHDPAGATASRPSRCRYASAAKANCCRCGLYRPMSGMATSLAYRGAEDDPAQWPAGRAAARCAAAQGAEDLRRRTAETVTIVLACRPSSTTARPLPATARVLDERTVDRWVVSGRLTSVPSPVMARPSTTLLLVKQLPAGHRIDATARCRCDQLVR